MSRTVWPASFQLQVVERAELLRSDAFRSSLKKQGADVNGTPVVLRWATEPLIGFPASPFSVWRRSPANYPIETLAGAANVSGTRRFDWGLRPMYLVSVAVTTVSGSARLVALDARGKVIPGQDLRVSTAGSVLLRTNGIAAIRVDGTASVSAIIGVPSELLANATGWERFDTVGLPLDGREVAPGRYQADPQGLEPPSLDGISAAIQRLALAEAAQLPPPALPAADLAPVDWPAPPPKPFLESVRAQLAGPLVECLMTRDNAAPFNRHSSYSFPANVQGISQIGTAGSSTNATVTLPLVGVVQLLVVGDGFGAVALGYGTMDLGNKGSAGEDGAQPEGPRLFATMAAAASVKRGFDYMVTGHFRQPFASGTVEVAALASLPLPPETPASLSIEAVHANRPPAVDQPAAEALRVSWLPEAQYTSYGVVASHATGSRVVLNAKRICGTGFDPFVPPRQPPVDGAPAPGDVVRFVDPVVPVPIAGTSLIRYAVASLDVFGRWSAWRMGGRTLHADAVSVPQILQLSLSPNASPVVGTTVGGTIEIELGWNAEDRSLERIELFGRFLAPSTTAEASFTGGFLNGAVSTAPLSVRLVGAPGTERVAAFEVLPATGANLRIRVTVTDSRFDFGSSNKAVFAVWARAYEVVRPTAASAVVGPRRAEAPDPRPPTIPPLLPGVTWTALPDATRRARGVLQWSAASNTRGYVVWEATETALRECLGLAAPTPGSSLLDRALAIQAAAALPGAEEAMNTAFARWNTDLLTATRAEIDLPGAADILYAYRLSAISTTNVEGARTTGLAFLAVPSRTVPGPPNLASTLAPGGVRLTASPAAGSFADGFRLYRVRKASAAAALGTMGPPVFLEAAWTPDPVEPGRCSLVDTPTPSWKPAYYRVVAIATDAPTLGRYGGESEPSGALPVLVTPAAPPTLTSVVTGVSRIDFSSDLPDFRTPIGTARIEVFEVAISGGRFVRSRVAAADPAEVHAGPPAGATLGKSVVGSVITWSIVRSLVTTSRYSIVVTDPLGRSTETTAEA